MKVGILTFHSGPNYGGYLQAFCLAQAIRQLGHEAEIINYKNRTHWNSERFRPWVYRRPGRLWHDFRRHRAFVRAIARMPLSPFSTDPNNVQWNSYDAIVVGSDIVWNCEYATFGHDPVYFGQFPVPYRGRLIAYATSTGFMKWDYPAPAWVAEGLRRFHAIGVRDEITRKFVEHQVGRDCPLVADPTWLTRLDEVESMRFPARTSREFLLVYAFALEKSAINEMRSFARENRLITAAVGYRHGWVDVNWSGMDPIEWVRMFRQARYVVTGTFHGTLYSILQQAQFCVLSHPAIDAKVVVPLTITNLQDRHTADPDAIQTILRKPINYHDVDAKRTDYAAESLMFLRRALSE